MATALNTSRRACTSSCRAMHTEQHTAGEENLNIQMSPSLTGLLVLHTRQKTHSTAAQAGKCLSDSHPSVETEPRLLYCYSVFNDINYCGGQCQIGVLEQRNYVPSGLRRWKELIQLEHIIVKEQPRGPDNIKLLNKFVGTSTAIYKYKMYLPYSLINCTDPFNRRLNACIDVIKELCRHLVVNWGHCRPRVLNSVVYYCQCRHTFFRIWTAFTEPD